MRQRQHWLISLPPNTGLSSAQKRALIVKALDADVHPLLDVNRMQMQLVANNPNIPGTPRPNARARAKIVPVRAVAVRTGGTASKPVDWEAF